MIGVACLVVAGFTGVGLVGPAVAYADNDGGSTGSTGQERACAVHSENNGNSYARGLECVPTLIVTVLGQSSEQPLNCSIHVTGTGLEPGSIVYAFLLGQPVISFDVGVVRANGTLNVTMDVFNQINTLVVRARTASGDIVEVRFVPAC